MTSMVRSQTVMLYAAAQSDHQSVINVEKEPAQAAVGISSVPRPVLFYCNHRAPLGRALRWNYRSDYGNTPAATIADRGRFQ